MVEGSVDVVVVGEVVLVGDDVVPEPVVVVLVPLPLLQVMVIGVIYGS